MTTQNVAQTKLVSKRCLDGGLLCASTAPKWWTLEAQIFWDLVNPGRLAVPHFLIHTAQRQRFNYNHTWALMRFDKELARSVRYAFSLRQVVIQISGQKENVGCRGNSGRVSASYCTGITKYSLLRLNFSALVLTLTDSPAASAPPSQIPPVAETWRSGTKTQPASAPGDS
eukprot:m.14232 g.14232  ORF g.14232 m.14232 type:complete len:171 (+) comp4766_c0_seq1:1463-1975(+)